MDILKKAFSNLDYMVNLRNYFHTNPELSGKEENTVKYIAQELTALGIEHVVVEQGGILAFIDGKGPGKTVLLRAECDALPLQEPEMNLSCKRKVISKVPGVMHACGHDANAAALLGAAKILQESREEFDGRVILMFERGEEGTSNVVMLLEYIYKNKIHIDSAFAAHVMNSLETGKVIIRSRETLATGLWLVNVTIKGKGGHGSRPDLCNNPIDCFVAIYNALQASRMKYTSPFNPFTFSIGTVKAGEAANIIPEEITFAGSYRFFDNTDGKRLYEMDLRLMENIAKAYGCQIEANALIGGPATMSDPECAQLAREAIGAAIGSENVCDQEPEMGSDSFSGVLQMWPGIYMQVGTKNPEKGSGADHHNIYFDIDEDSMAYSATSAVAYALGFLSSFVDTSDRVWTGTPASMFKHFGSEMIMRDVYRNFGLDTSEFD